MGKGTSPPVNAPGALLDGRGYDSPEAFKRPLVADLDKFGEAFVEQLPTFALRRVMTVEDVVGLKAVALAAGKGGCKLQTFLKALVLSDLFPTR